MEARPGVRPEEVFGCSFAELRYETVRDLVENHVGSEPLLWEAKGADVVEKKRPEVLRKAVSAFANSRDGGFVFLGVEEVGKGRDVALKASGARFPDDEPGRWISTALTTFQLRPRPWFDVQQIAVPGGEGRRIAVVWVPPMAAPPCIADGSVYERVVGVSLPVQDPTRLAAIYQRGQDRHEAARSLAETGQVALGLKSMEIEVGVPGALARVCIAPLQQSVTLQRRLFTRATYDAVEQRLRDLGATNSPSFADVAVTQSQNSIGGRLRRPQGRPLAALMTIAADGQTAVASKGLGGNSFEALMWTWQLATELYAIAAGSDGPFEHYLAALTSGESGDVARFQLGPLTYPEVGDPTREALEREIERAAGRFAFEPEY